MIGIQLGITPWKEIKKYKYSVAVIPRGATEPHNLHLPYLTDCILAKDIALKVVSNVAKNKAIVLPEIAMGSQNPGQTEYPFCIHYTQETQKHILSDIVVSLEKQGITKILIINGHMGNCFKPIIRDLKQTNPKTDIIVVNWLDIPELPHSKYFDNEEDHAGEIETSAMMYLHPELINLSDAGKGLSKGFSMSTLRRKIGWTPRNWKLETEDTGIGDPGLSTVDKGKSYICDVINLISELLTEFIEKRPYAVKEI
jgi:creatinine amidohydrolase